MFASSSVTNSSLEQGETVYDMAETRREVRVLAMASSLVIVGEVVGMAGPISLLAPARRR